MPEETAKSPSRRLLLLTGAAALVTAGTVAATGIVGRSEAKKQLVQWTDQAAIPTVRLARLDRGAAEQSLVLPGNIQPYYKAPIYARVSGYLKDWQADIGARVRSGQVLASIDTPDLDQQLLQAQANLATARANEQLTAITAGRWSSLAASQWVSRQANDEKAGAAAAARTTADAAEANVRQLEAMESFKRIVAPFDGIVTQRNIDVGALVSAGTGNSGQALFEVSDLHKVRVYVQVPQALSAGLIAGLKATFEMPQYPGRRFDATLVTTSHAMDVSTRGMLIELQAENADGGLDAGAYCQVHFMLPGDPNMVRVPATALVPVDQGVQVAILGNGDKAMLRTVRLGRDFGDTVEVTSGLAPMDQVIDSPPETLRNGDQVRLAGTTAGKAVVTGASVTKAD